MLPHPMAPPTTSRVATTTSRAATSYAMQHPEVVPESAYESYWFLPRSFVHSLAVDEAVKTVVKEQGSDIGAEAVAQRWQCTVDYLRGVIAAAGPFDGIAGFSEGAATAHNLLCMQASGVDVGLSSVKFVIALSPWISPMLEGTSARIQLPLLLSLGRADLEMCESGPIFAADFAEVLTYEHAGEHEYPLNPQAPCTRGRAPRADV